MASDELRNAVLNRFPLASAPPKDAIKETAQPRVAVEEEPPIEECKGTPDMPSKLLNKTGDDLLGEALLLRKEVEEQTEDVDENRRKGIREKVNANIDTDIIKGILG